MKPRKNLSNVQPLQSDKTRVARPNIINDDIPDIRFYPSNPNYLGQRIGYNMHGQVIGYNDPIIHVISEEEGKQRARNYAPIRREYERKERLYNALRQLKKTITPANRPKAKTGIYIKPENRGKFTETMRRTGKTAEELSHSSNPLTRKRAIFALNARKWNH